MRSDHPLVPDTGSGEPPVVDVGAHEMTIQFADGFESGDTSAWSVGPAPFIRPRE